MIYFHVFEYNILQNSTCANVLRIEIKILVDNLIWNIIPLYTYTYIMYTYICIYIHIFIEYYIKKSKF